MDSSLKLIAIVAAAIGGFLGFAVLQGWSTDPPHTLGVAIICIALAVLVALFDG